LYLYTPGAFLVFSPLRKCFKLSLFFPYGTIPRVGLGLRLFLSIVALLFLFALWFYYTLPEVGYLKKQNPKTTAIIELRKEQAAVQHRKLRIRQSWVRFRNIPKRLKQAVRITEDASFYKHEGVDYEEIKESIKRDLREGKLSRGGSTITQQLAKNLYFSTNKSFFRKIKEYFVAKRLEAELSKNRIFHLYLNLIEWGPGIFGIQAASRYYFEKNVWDLSLEESIRLTAIIPRPLRTNPTSKNRWLLWKCRWILRKMKLYGFISQSEYNLVKPSFNQ